MVISRLYIDIILRYMTTKYKNVAHNDTSYWILKILVQCVSINVRNILGKYELKTFCPSTLIHRSVFGYFWDCRR